MKSSATIGAPRNASLELEFWVGDVAPVDPCIHDEPATPPRGSTHARAVLGAFVGVVLGVPVGVVLSDGTEQVPAAEVTDGAALLVERLDGTAPTTVHQGSGPWILRPQDADGVEVLELGHDEWVIVRRLAPLSTTVPRETRPGSPDVIEEVEWNEHDEFRAHERWGPDWCPKVQFPVRVESDAVGTFRRPTHGTSPYDHGESAVQETRSYTNEENGKTLSVMRHGTDEDVTATWLRDDVVLVEARTIGLLSLWSVPPGKPLSTHAGRFAFTVQINTGTPSDPQDDEVLEYESGRFAVLPTGDGDFCEDVVQLIG